MVGTPDGAAAICRVLSHLKQNDATWLADTRRSLTRPLHIIAMPARQRPTVLIGKSHSLAVWRQCGEVRWRAQNRLSFCGGGESANLRSRLNPPESTIISIGFPDLQRTYRWQVPDVRPAKQCDNTTVTPKAGEGKPKWNGMGGGASKDSGRSMRSRPLPRRQTACGSEV